MPGMIETLEAAAKVMDQYAAELKRAHTVRGMFNGTPEDVTAKKDHDALKALAKDLRKIAAYHKPNPLGGPAKVFDVMADRIRAGDKFDYVLKDYGFQVVKGKK